MKKIFAALIISLIAISASAQEHFKIKGVSMDGTLNEIVSKFKRAGLKESMYSTPDNIVLEGSFAGISGCKFIFGDSIDGKYVFRIGIMTPFENSWSSILSRYESLKESYTAKYGEPKVIEYFSDPYELGDGYEIQAISNKKGVYTSYFFVDEGAITIDINGTSSREGYVMITYEDSVNLEKAKAARDVIVNEEI